MLNTTYAQVRKGSRFLLEDEEGLSVFIKLSDEAAKCLSCKNSLVSYEFVPTTIVVVQNSNDINVEQLSVQSSEVLFNEAMSISTAVMHTAAIIQNSVIIDTNELKNAELEFNSVCANYKEWWQKVLKHIVACNTNTGVVPDNRVEHVSKPTLIAEK